MRHTLVVGSATLLAVFAACTPPAATEGTHNTTSSIINGTESTSADDSVVLLWMTNEFCTGSLIAPNLVLTARHCVSEENTQSECGPFGADKSPSDVGVALGVHPSSTAIVAHGTKLFLETQNTICGQDIALVMLDKDVPGVTLKKVRLTPPVMGELVTAMGYGVDENQQLNGRMSRSGIAIQAVGPATASVGGTSADVPANDFMTGESVCNGDSGGPIFDAQGLIMGTTSRGTSAGCVNAPAIFSSTGAHAAIIKTALAAAGHPLDINVPIPDAGTPMDGSVIGTGGGGATDPTGGVQPSGPTPSPANPDDGTGDQGGDNTGDNAADTTDTKKKKSSDDDDGPVAHRPAIQSSSCSSSSTPHTGVANGGLLIAFAAAFAFARRRRSKHSR